MTKWILNLQKFASQWWYNYVIALFAGADHFIMIVPTDGLVASAAALNPKKWLQLAMLTALGSTLGATILAGGVREWGLPFLQEHYSALLTSAHWVLAQSYFEKYGLLFVFLLAAGPVAMQPGVILVGLSSTNLAAFTMVVVVGRVIKYILLASISVYAPSVLSKLWGVRGEIAKVFDKTSLPKG